MVNKQELRKFVSEVHRFAASVLPKYPTLADQPVYVQVGFGPPPHTSEIVRDLAPNLTFEEWESMIGALKYLAKDPNDPWKRYFHAILEFRQNENQPITAKQLGIRSMNVLNRILNKHELPFKVVKVPPPPYQQQESRHRATYFLVRTT